MIYEIFNRSLPPNEKLLFVNQRKFQNLPVYFVTKEHQQILTRAKDLVIFSYHIAYKQRRQ